MAEPIATRRRFQRQPEPGLRRWGPRLEWSIAATDALVVAGAVGFAHALRFGLNDDARLLGNLNPNYLMVSGAIAVMWWVGLGLAGSRNAAQLGHGPQELQRIVTASWRVFAIVAVVGFATQWDISRGYLVVALPVGMVALLASRGLWRLWIHRQRDKGQLESNALLVGTSENVAELYIRFQRARRTGFRVVGVASVPGHDDSFEWCGPDVAKVGPLTSPLEQCDEVDADVIVVAGAEALSFEESRKLGWALEGTNIGLLVAPSLADVAGPRIKMTPVAGLPLLSVTAPTFAGPKFYVKAMLDRSGALVLLALLAIPMAIIALVIRATSPGPAIFVQERIGVGMTPFRMYKFRSMHVDAEQRLQHLLAADEGSGAMFKIKNDPRVTPVGRVLRRLSLDELPQLFNVLKGDMSLVGPRPPLAREVAAWEEHVERRQLVKPGLTGLWQVSGRSDLSWEESVRLDLYYADNWTLGGDLLILVRTVFTVLKPRGAY